MLYSTIRKGSNAISQVKRNRAKFQAEKLSGNQNDSQSDNNADVASRSKRRKSKIQFQGADSTPSQSIQQDIMSPTDVKSKIQQDMMKRRIKEKQKKRRDSLLQPSKSLLIGNSATRSVSNDMVSVSDSSKVVGNGGRRNSSVNAREERMSQFRKARRKSMASGGNSSVSMHQDNSMVELVGMKNQQHLQTQGNQDIRHLSAADIGLSNTFANDKLQMRYHNSAQKVNPKQFHRRMTVAPATINKLSSVDHSCCSSDEDSSSESSDAERRARIRRLRKQGKTNYKKDEEANCCMAALGRCCSASCGWLYEASESVGATAWRKDWAEYEERLLSIRDETLFIVHGASYHFSKTSLGLLDNKNKIRIACVWVITSKWFENAISTLIFINSVLLGLKDYTDTENKTFMNQMVEATEPFFTAFFLIECLFKITAQGIIFGQNCYLDEAWNWLDFLVVVTSLLTAIPSLESISGLRTFRLFRPLRSLQTMPSMRIFIGTLLSSLSHLSGIFGLGLFIFMIFAILGVTLWEGAMHYRCYTTPEPLPDGTWTLAPNDKRLCSAARACPAGTYCNSISNVTHFGYKIKGMEEEVDIWRDSHIPELNWGLTNFDNIGYALVTIFECIIGEGWSTVMNIYGDTYAAAVVNIYFVLCVFICSFFLLNMTIAVMLMKYQELERQQVSSKRSEELRRIGQSVQLPTTLADFLLVQDSIQLSSMALRLLKQEDSFAHKMLSTRKLPIDISEPYYKNRVVQLNIRAASNPYFDGFVLLAIIANTVIQALDQHPPLDAGTLSFLSFANVVFTAVFTVEVVVKLIALGVRPYFRDGANAFDFVIVVVSLASLEAASEGGVFSALRAFRLFKIFRLLQVGDLRVLLDSISFTVTTIGDYVILLMLFVYVFALLGMSLFAGNMKFDERGYCDLKNGTPPRAHFDTIGASLMTIFQVLMNEKWTEVMFSAFRCVSIPTSAVYFVVLVLSVNIVMLKLFLAILLGNFEKARTFGEKKKIFEAFKEIRDSGQTLYQSIDIIMGDLSMHAKVKVLKWNETIVYQAHVYGESALALELMEEGAQFDEALFVDYEREDSLWGEDLDINSNDGQVVQHQLERKRIKQCYDNPNIDGKQDEEGGNGDRVDEKNASFDESQINDFEGPSQLSKAPTVARNPLDDQSEKTGDGTSNVGGHVHHEGEECNAEKEEHAPAEILALPQPNQQQTLGGRPSQELKYVKLVEFVHEELPQIRRTQELNRAHNLRASFALKAILEKEQSLDEGVLSKKYNINDLEQQKEDDNDEGSQSQRSNKEPQVHRSPLYAIASGRNAEIDESTRDINISMNKPSHAKRASMTAERFLADFRRPDRERGENEALDDSYRGRGADQDSDAFVRSARHGHQNSMFAYKTATTPLAELGHAKSQKDLKVVKTYDDGIVGGPFSDELTNKSGILGRINKMQHIQNKVAVDLGTGSAPDPSQDFLYQNERSDAGSGDHDADLRDSERRKRLGCFGRFWKNSSDSSLFVFHKDGAIRRFCLGLVERPEVLAEIQAARLEEEEAALAELASDLAADKNKLTTSMSDVGSVRLDSVAGHLAEEIQAGETISQPGSLPQNNIGDHRSSEGSVFLRSPPKPPRKGLIVPAGVAKPILVEPSVMSKGGQGAADKLSVKSAPPSAPRTRGLEPPKVTVPVGQPESHHKLFDNIVLCLIIFSSLTLVLDNPLDDPDSTLKVVLSHVDLAFTCLFAGEALVKIIAKGLVSTSLPSVQPYLCNSWNALDAFVVLAAVADLGVTQTGDGSGSGTLQALKSLRALRALRPLRVISRNEGMRLIVKALLASLPSMANVLLVYCLFLLIFGVIAVNFFKGRFHYCKQKWDAKEPLDLDKVDTKADCLRLGGDWVNYDSNFDNVFDAMMTLFIMSSTEGWIDIMRLACDSRGVDLQPKRNANPDLGASIAYFVGFMIVGSQFIINLFAGVVIDNFNKVKEKEELGNMFVTQQQKSWIELQRIGLAKHLRAKLKEPAGFRKCFFRVVNSAYFEQIITVFIVLNTAVMSMKFHNMPDNLVELAAIANYVFAAVFNLEMIMKLAGLGRTYFHSNWNIFDMFVVVSSDISLLLQLMSIDSSVSTAVTVIRGVRIMRMLRLIKTSASIRLILDTIMNILPQINTVLGLLALLIFIYAALGVNLFSQVMFQDTLDEKSNFRDFGGAMLVLMRFATGEDWHLFMYELATTEYHGQRCVESQTYQDMQRDGIKGCGTPLSFAFFVSFRIIISMLTLNLSVAAVIEGLDTAKKENLGEVQGDEIEHLLDVWMEFDPNATGWISIPDLIFLLHMLRPPLGRRASKAGDEDQVGASVKGGSDEPHHQEDRYICNFDKGIVLKKKVALELLSDLKIKFYDNGTERGIHFSDVYRALMKRVLIERGIDYKLSPSLNRKMKNYWASKFKDCRKDRRGHLTVQKEYAGLIITSWARKILNMQKNHAQLKKTDAKLRRRQQLQLRKGRQIDADAIDPCANDTPEFHQTIAAEKQKRRIEVLKENAAIIYGIIKGNRNNVEEDSDNDEGMTRTRNEFTWQHDGAKHVLAQLEREDFDDCYGSEMSEDAKRDFEDRYEAYKRERERAIRQNKQMKKAAGLNKGGGVRELFTDSALNNVGLQVPKEDQKEMDLVVNANPHQPIPQKTLLDVDIRRPQSRSHFVKRSATSLRPIGLVKIAEEGDEDLASPTKLNTLMTNKNDDERTPSFAKSNTMAESSIHKQITIKVGSLETGEVKTDETNIFKMAGARPTRDAFAERYDREAAIGQAEAIEEAEESSLNSNSASEEDKVDEEACEMIKEGKAPIAEVNEQDADTFVEQERKNMLFRRRQKEEKQQKIAELEALEADDRSPADLRHDERANSNEYMTNQRTIELDEPALNSEIHKVEAATDQARRRYEVLQEALTLELVPQNLMTVTDLKSNSELDKLLLPARAVRETESKEDDEAKDEKELKEEPIVEPIAEAESSAITSQQAPYQTITVEGLGLADSEAVLDESQKPFSLGVSNASQPPTGGQASARPPSSTVNLEQAILQDKPEQLTVTAEQFPDMDQVDKLYTKKQINEVVDQAQKRMSKDSVPIGLRARAMFSQNSQSRKHEESKDQD